MSSRLPIGVATMNRALGTALFCHRLWENAKAPLDERGRRRKPVKLVRSFVTGVPAAMFENRAAIPISIRNQIQFVPNLRPQRRQSIIVELASRDALSHIRLLQHPLRFVGTATHVTAVSER